MDRNRTNVHFFKGKLAKSRHFRWDENHLPWMTLKVSTATWTV